MNGIYKTSILCVFILFICCNMMAQDVSIGGKIAYSMPTNIGRSSDELGFNDVAKGGVHFAFVGKWFYNERLTLGYDFGYQFQKGDEGFWDVDNRGDVSASYQTVRLLIDGCYYFSHDEVRPYVGLAFGAYYLNNNMDFTANSITNTSVAYRAKEWKPGIAPQFGVLFELSKKTMLDCKLQMDLIAHLEPTVSHDPNYGMVTQNPHGNQNQFNLSVALLFEL